MIFALWLFIATPSAREINNDYTPMRLYERALAADIKRNGHTAFSHLEWSIVWKDVLRMRALRKSL